MYNTIKQHSHNPKLFHPVQGLVGIICMYKYVCVCVCVFFLSSKNCAIIEFVLRTVKVEHKYIYIYIYIYICVRVIYDTQQQQL